MCGLKLFIFLSYLNVMFAQNEQKPKFRILAPQFICPKDEEAVIAKADETVIMLQTPAGADFDVEWAVNWVHLPAPTQRQTLMIWRTVRALERILNRPQKERYVYVIENAELLRGVNFVFTVTVRSGDSDEAESKSFQIDNSHGDNVLDMVDGRSDMFSIVMLGSQVAYPDIEFVLEAKVTTCFPTEDYHFAWTIQGHSIDDTVNVSQEMGARMSVPINALKAGVLYDANCQVIRASTGEFITQTGLPFQVSRRGLEVFLSADVLLISKDAAFTVNTLVLNHDYSSEDLAYEWTCTFMGNPCVSLESKNEAYLNFESGLPELGDFEIEVKVMVKDESETAKMGVIVKEPNLLPILEVTPVPRIVNEGTKIALVANASNVTPTCSLTWYFSRKDENSFKDNNENCEAETDTAPCSILVFLQHGESISDTVTIYSLEENFLSELADFTNDTAWIEVPIEFPAAAGRARLVADCGCSLTFSCETQGLVYADLLFVVNESPKAGGVLVSPTSGVALESVFRISTQAVVDPDTPLKYSFYCSVGEESLLLAYYIEHLSLETILPYVDGGTHIWVEVCDAAGACSKGAPTIVQLAKGEGRTVNALGAAVLGHMRRCELMLLQRVAVSALVTYTNAGLQVALNAFSTNLEDTLGGKEAEICNSQKSADYSTLLQNLAKVGFDTSMHYL